MSILTFQQPVVFRPGFVRNMYLPKDEFSSLIKALPPKAVCDSCGKEMVLVVKDKDDRRIFFYLCQDSECAHNTEPFLISVF